MTQTPNYEVAAIKACELLIKYNISTAPVMPLTILKRMPGVLVLSFSEISSLISFERKNIVTLFGLENQDAVTSVMIDNGKLHYLVAFNQLLPLYMVQRALARELGHIVLQHDGSKPEDIRQQEALCFASHLLCPRALIHSIEEAGCKLTVETVGSVTGCYGRCLSIMRKLPGVSVPKELNQTLKTQFAEYVDNFANFQRVLVKHDPSPLAEFGSFIDGYTE